MENTKWKKNTIYSIIAVIIVGVAACGGTYFLTNDDDGDKETYSFYLYFGDGNASNGWQSGTGTNAAEGFESAMSNAGFTYEYSDYGYLKSINGTNNSWMTYQYLYSSTSDNAEAASILYPVSNYGLFACSNGWSSIAGYDEEGTTFKLSEIDSTVFIMSNFVYGTGTEKDPVTIYDQWSNSGIFA